MTISVTDHEQLPSRALRCRTFRAEVVHMAVAISELHGADDALIEWVPVARAAEQAGVTPAAVRRAGRDGTIAMRQGVVGRRRLTVVPLADVLAVLGPPGAQVEEALRRADDAVDRVERAEELVRFLRDQVVALHQANEDLQREVTRLGQEQFRQRAGSAVGEDVRLRRTNGRRMWRRRASLN